ncbi:MAG: hypothetical protein OXH20_01975 [bacterium]|nr:hypothetical protein [bacterium]MXZ29591.1 hypothetical protein [Acidimicrobiia bacterium]MYB25808.1 hypothetical protein [Acidimicrobiia bacterium]
MAEIQAIDVAAKKFNRAMIGSSVLLFGVLALWLGITGDADPPYFNVAFTSSWVVACLGFVAVLAYARRRPTDAPVTWGGAMMGATLAFFLMFWIYGVVPHWWLVFADSELNWRADRMLVGPPLPGWWAPEQNLLTWALPFDLTYRVARDVVATVIYGFALVGQIAVHVIWQNRDRPPVAVPEPASRYGRPLVREGAQA